MSTKRQKQVKYRDSKTINGGASPLKTFNMPAKIQVNPGDKYGRLTIISEVKEGKGRSFFCCCECGKNIVIRFEHLRSGHTKSCGCLKSETTTKRSTIHGDSNTRLFRTWASMIARCYSKNTRGYKYYGSRGIVVCDEWREFIGFKEWALSSGYAENLTIERQDFDGNYEPSNCIWITQAFQTKNSRHNQLVVLDGVTYTLTDAAKKIGISRHSIYERLKYMSIDEAFKLQRYQHYAPRMSRVR